VTLVTKLGEKKDAIWNDSRKESKSATVDSSDTLEFAKQNFKKARATAKRVQVNLESFETTLSTSTRGDAASGEEIDAAYTSRTI